MNPDPLAPQFFVWGEDQTVYGPVELPVLVSWIREERVAAGTWVFVGRTGAWQTAGAIEELRMFFRSRPSFPGAQVAASPQGIDSRGLRRIKILAELTDEQLERFSRFVSVERFPQWSIIVRQHDRGDRMYFILEGELRVRLDALGKEIILASLGPGDFFGDISLLDHGPRSADVVANTDTVVAAFSSSAFDALAREAPEVATPFLRAIGKTLTARIRADNKRYGDSVKLALAGAGHGRSGVVAPAVSPNAR